MSESTLNNLWYKCWLCGLKMFCLDNILLKTHVKHQIIMGKLFQGLRPLSQF